MKALKNLSKKIINCILAIAVFFSTGITTVFAEEAMDNETKLKNNFIQLNTKVSSLKTLIENSEYDNTFDNINDVLDEFSNNNLKFTYFVNYIIPIEEVLKYDATENKITVTNESKKDTMITDAQNVTTQYIKITDELSSIVGSINFTNTNKINITNLKNNINDIITRRFSIGTNSGILYNIEMKQYNKLDNSISELANINTELKKVILEYNVQSLKSNIEMLRSKNETNGFDNTLVEKLQNKVNDNDSITEEDYNNYLSEYKILLNTFIELYSDKLIDEIATNEDAYKKSELEIKYNDFKQIDPNNVEEVFNKKLNEKINGFNVPKTEEERESGLKTLRNLELLKEIQNNIYNEQNINDLDTKIKLYSKSSLANLIELEIHGYKFENSEIESGEMELSVSNEVEEVQSEYVVSPKATVVIDGTSGLKVGKNTITIVITAENGNQKTYTVNVNRLEKYVGVGEVTETPKEEQKETPIVVQTSTEETVNTEYNEDKIVVVATNNNVTSSNEEKIETEDTTKDKSNTSDSSSKYNEEIEEETSPLTTMLVIAGIALVGFGIYMLFGKEEDDIKVAQKKEEVEIKKVEIKKSTNQNKKNTNNNSKNKTNNKKTK